MRTLIKTRCLFFASLYLIVFFFILNSCKKPDPVDETKYGKIRFEFLHYWGDEPLVYDTLMYQNTSLNELMINEIQYFISNVTLQSSFGSQMIDDWVDIYYIDKDIPSTLTWNVYDRIPVGNYQSLSFIFGIPASKNIPYMYVNPPERDMFWPIFLGGEQGGYHYMKINGKWLELPENQITPFDFHLGVGQIYASGVVNVDSITGFVQNYFTVAFPDLNFAVEEEKTTVIEMVMDVSEWFENPNDFDLEIWGGYIMQNQDAMHMACENGLDVFSVKNIYIE
jgi:hypothetical protein